MTVPVERVVHTGAEGDGMGLIERRQEAIDALLGVLNDIGGGQRDNYNVSHEAAGKAIDATGLLTDTQGAVEDRDALSVMLTRLLDVALVDGYGETVRDEAEALLARIGGQS